MDNQLDRQIKFDKVSPLEFIYQQISVDAMVEKQVSDGKGGYKNQPDLRRILKNCSGKFQPKTVTAIMGPSGSGKTTMLNLLSGRLLSKNLILRGKIKINGKPVDTMADYKSIVGYVMQEDLMLPTFTPKQTFRFITDMRLPDKTDQQKDAIVDSMIVSLGLTRCAETYVGNSLIRGLSGGQKKRTSVGVELLINPSIIFLDQPTTGLDSTTALNLIKFLNRLADSGRTVVTTIHQPSSQIFLQFDMILLLLDGNVVYHNKAQESMNYFSKLGMPVPLRSNPMDHYMKLMNKQGITLRLIDQGKQVHEQQVIKQFDERIQYLVRSYKSQVTAQTVNYKNELQQRGKQATWLRQFQLLFKRTVKNQLRNPLGIRAKIFQVIFFALVTLILYYRQATDLNTFIQNTAGLLFFTAMNVSFASIFNSINIFSQERPVFIRQRLSNTYTTSSYFFGRSFAYLPLEMFLPTLMITIFYFDVNLFISGQHYFLTIACSWLCAWMGSAYGLLLSTAFADPEVALTLVPILVIPLMLVGGLYAPLERVPKFFTIFQYISMFKYHYQTIVYAQFFDQTDNLTITLNGQSSTFPIKVMASGGPLYSEDPYWVGMFLMGIIGFVIRILSLIALYFISNPKKLKLQPPQKPTQNMPTSPQPLTYKPLMMQKNQSINNSEQIFQKQAQQVH